MLRKWVATTSCLRRPRGLYHRTDDHTVSRMKRWVRPISRSSRNSPESCPDWSTPTQSLSISREVFAQTPTTHKEGALALGATKWEMIRTAVLPFGKPGVISAAMLGLGRALGETLAVMIILSALSDGTSWNWSLFNGGSTFASKIAGSAGEFDTPAKTGAYIGAGLVLFVLTFAVNAMARIVIERRKAFTE